MLHVACCNGRAALIQLLLTDYGFEDEINNDDNKIKVSAFVYAVMSFVQKDCRPECLKLMLSKGADILMKT